MGVREDQVCVVTLSLENGSRGVYEGRGKGCVWGEGEKMFAP